MEDKQVIYNKAETYIYEKWSKQRHNMLNKQRKQSRNMD